MFVRPGIAPLTSLIIFVCLLTSDLSIPVFSQGKETGSGVPKEGPVVDFNGIRCILYLEISLNFFK